MSEQDSCSNGLSLIKEIKELHKNCAISISSHHSDNRFILNALSLGACDFYCKSDLSLHLKDRLLQVRDAFLIKNGCKKIENHKSNQKNYAGQTIESIKARIQSFKHNVIKSILIEGESGTGKEVVIDLIEDIFPDKKPVVRINCGALPLNLLESELFGSSKGSFTGSTSDKIGLVEAASGGFLFLDEISSLPLSAQSSLLRCIENQEIMRIGETKIRQINVTFICATNVKLKTLVEQNKFRNDLYQRLKDMEIILPPLRARKNEIHDLILFFAERLEGGPYFIEPLALQLLCSFDWREGNVRELKNCLRNMTRLHVNKVLCVNSLPESFFQQPEITPPHEAKITLSLMDQNGSLKNYEELCIDLFQEIYGYYKSQQNEVNLSELSRLLKISRSSLYEKLRRLR